jgi:LacI family transcriptional regulator
VQVITSRDVAAAAGVSQATVSRALSGAARVSPVVRTKVLEAAERLGYQPNVAARAMRTQRSGSIGVVVESVTNPFYPEMIGALSRYLAANDLRMLLWDAEGAGEQAAVQAISQRLVDGLVFTTAVETSATLRTALEAGAPLVLVNRTVESAPCDQVDTDNQSMAHRIAQYVGSAGRTTAGFISGPDEASTARARREGFLAGARAYGVKVPRSRVVDGGLTHRGGYDALHQLFRGRVAPTAVFCANDISAFGAIDAARALGVRVPDDLWVVGYDDTDMASWEAFDLTTARQPVEQMVKAAIDLLLQRIDSPGKPGAHERFESTLVLRGSTGRHPLPDADY